MQINFFTLVFIISSVFLIIISIPLILKKIKPNNYYGFRVKKTMENEEIWYKANKFSGIILLIAEILYLIVFMFLLLFNNKLVSNNLYIIHLIIFITPLIFTAIISFIYVYKLKPSSPVNKQSENFLKKSVEVYKNKRKPIFLILALLAIIFICISIPPIFEKVPPNGTYGFRVKKAFQSEELWYKINKFGGIALFISGLVTFVISILSLIFLKNISDNLSKVLFFLIFLIPLFIGIFITILYANSL